MLYLLLVEREKEKKKERKKNKKEMAWGFFLRHALMAEPGGIFPAVRCN
jgi:DNA-binding transcriptional regulator PaaX